MNNELQEKIFVKARQMIKRHGIINLCRFELCEAVGVKAGSFALIMGYGFPKFIKKLRAENPELERRQVSTDRARVNPALRKENILQVAMVLAIRSGYTDVTPDEIAEGAGVTRGLVHHYFGPMRTIRRVIMRRAVEQGVLEIVAQGLSRGDLLARRAPEELRKKALQRLMGV